MSDTSRHQAIRSILSADATLAALVTDTVDDQTIVKVRPGHFADTDEPPGLIVEVPNDANVDDLDGLDDTGDASVQIVCIAYTRDGAHQLAVQVKRVLNGFRGSAAGLTIDPASYAGAKADEEHPDDDSTDSRVWYLEILTFSVWWRA